MIILGLDLSTSTGYAVTEDGKPISYGTYLAEVNKIKTDIDLNKVSTNFTYLERARLTASFVSSVVSTYKPDKIVIEEVNRGKNRHSQKLIDSVHCMVLDALKENAEKVIYVDTSRWRSVLSIKLSKEQRENNKLVKKKLKRGKITWKHLSVDFINERYNLKLKLKDNDQCDALCLCLYGETIKNNIKEEVDLDEIFT